MLGAAVERVRFRRTAPAEPLGDTTVLETAFRYLLDRKLTTIKEIEHVTGRGSSTIYRWMNGESQPHFTDIRQLVRGLKDPEARRTMVGLLASDLPVVIKWIDDEAAHRSKAEENEPRDGHEVLERTLLALDCVTQVLHEQHEAIRKQSLTEDVFADLLRLMDDAIRYLTNSKNLLQRYKPAGPGDDVTDSAPVEA
jgi:hypothetical protein